jgi:16S rRNA (cytidine1402-2'-O)-methyltransferase
MPAPAFAVKPGTLYLVSTPIGNLRDISLRALDVLQGVDLIAAEDTRTSTVLLHHYDVQTPMTSHHDFNKERVAPSLISKLRDGSSIAVITDAGTPGVSDPAFYLVREAIKENITIEAIPGATAFVPALVLSGLATDRFVFEGFLPPKKGRHTRLQDLAVEPRTIILYESPHRITKTLAELYEYLGNRQVAVVRELTKKFETVVRGSLEDILQQPESITLKGEFVLVIEGLTRDLQKQLKKKKYEK